VRGERSPPTEKGFVIGNQRVRMVLHPESEGRCIPDSRQPCVSTPRIVFSSGVRIDATPWAQRTFNTLGLTRL
jgi:hypothetical protein